VQSTKRMAMISELGMHLLQVINSGHISSCQVVSSQLKHCVTTPHLSSCASFSLSLEFQFEGNGSNKQYVRQWACE
jgi:hypothetical protein